MKKLKCYIYGAGTEYNKLASYLEIYKEKIEIIAIVTTQKQKISILDGISCITPDEIHKEQMDYIIIAVQKWKEIYNYLKKFEIEDEKILRSHIFYLPNFVLDEYLKLKNSNISILSNTCLGGRIYKELGLKVLSPTVNALCPRGEDYINFLRNYKLYLGMDMEELNGGVNIFQIIHLNQKV